MQFVKNLTPADELRWLLYQQARLVRQLDSTPPLRLAPASDVARLHQAYHHLQVRQVALLAVLGGRERCCEALCILSTWPQI